MTATEIGHVYGYSHRCDRNWGILTFQHGYQNTSFQREKEMMHFGFGENIHTRDLSLSKPFWGILATPVYYFETFPER